MAKQKLKGYYGNIGEKQFKKYYQEAVRRQGRYRPEPDRHSGIASGCGSVPVQAGANRICRSPDHQPWSCAAERQAL